MLKALLIIHVISAALWLGGAVYERFVVLHSAKKAVGSKREMEMINLFLRSERVLVPASVMLLLTGLAMTFMAGYGFFHANWLGMKQYVMAGILLIFIFYSGPRTGDLKKRLAQDEKLSGTVSEATRMKFWRMYVGFDLIHLGVALNVILAVWKP